MLLNTSSMKITEGCRAVATANKAFINFSPSPTCHHLTNELTPARWEVPTIPPKALGKRKWWSKSAKCFCNHTANLVIEMSSKGYSAKCFGKHHKYLFSLKLIWANWKDFTDTIRSHHKYCKFLYTYNFKSTWKELRDNLIIILWTFRFDNMKATNQKSIQKKETQS